MKEREKINLSSFSRREAKEKKLDFPIGLKSAEGKEEERKVIVKSGYARAGGLIATLKPAIPGKDGKNILGEPIKTAEFKNPRLVAGKNVRVENGLFYYMKVNGSVEVLKDEKGIYYVRGNLYSHGRFNITVSQDEMKTFLSVAPPLGGGKPVKPEEIFEKCKTERVIFGLKEDVIRDTIQKVNAERVAIKDEIIALGEDALDGKDGKLEFRVSLASGTKTRLLEDGRVDYREQDLITSVQEGQLIAVITKATKGLKDGHTVKGEKITAKAGQGIELKIGNNVKEEDRGETINYSSQINGQLITDGKILSVEPILVVNEDVGPKTGNIKFNGIVHVKGNVSDNFQVYARKDITIQGNVGSAIVRSDGNIFINNGVIGKNRGLVYAKGDVTVKFAENSNIQAGGNISIHRAALNCSLIAGGNIISRDERGQIVGGEIKARKVVEAKILGNESEHKMEVHVGGDFFLEILLKDLRLKLHRYEVALKNILLLREKLERITPNPLEFPERLRKIYFEAQKKKTLFLVAINDLKKKEINYLEKQEDVRDSAVIVHESLFPGVRIYFGKSFYDPEVTKTNVRVYYDETFEKIKIGNI